MPNMLQDIKLKVGMLTVILHASVPALTTLPIHSMLQYFKRDPINKNANVPQYGILQQVTYKLQQGHL